MIPVTPQPEPANFDSDVRRPGMEWLANHGIPSDAEPPDPGSLPPYWRKTGHELWTAYKGICSYLCIYFEWDLGASSTDHFIAKSQIASQAYEWSNYRLACQAMNRKKNRFDDILDPFELQQDTFFLDFLSGEMIPNPVLPEEMKELATTTITRLKLNDSTTKEMRIRHFSHYTHGQWDSLFLRMNSPFVWYEANRQGLL